MTDASQNTVVSLGGSAAITLAVREGWVQTPQDFGAKNDGSVDDGVAINAALATGQDVYMPAGTYYVATAIHFTTPGQRLMGAGRSRTRIVNYSALPSGGFITTTSMEPGPIIEDLGFYLPQPTSGTSFNQWPPCIYLSGAPRSQIRRVRRQSGWQGLIFNGNCGGSIVEDVETCCLSQNIVADQCFDTMRFTRVHCYPFDGVNSNANQLGQFVNSAQGIYFGRVDDFILTDCLFFLRTAVNLHTGSDGNGSFGSIVNCDFDTYGGLTVTNGAVTINGGQLNIGDPSSYAIFANGAPVNVTVSGSLIVQGVAPSNPAQALVTAGQGANITVRGCVFNQNAYDGRAAFFADSASFGQVTGSSFQRSPSENYAWGGIVYAGGCRPLVVGNRHNPQPSGSTTQFVQIVQDAPGVIFCNDFGNTHLSANTAWTDIQVIGNASMTRP